MNATARPNRRPERSIRAPKAPAVTAPDAWISVLGRPARVSLARPLMIRLASTVLTVVAPVASAWAAYSGATRPTSSRAVPDVEAASLMAAVLRGAGAHASPWAFQRSCTASFRYVAASWVLAPGVNTRPTPISLRVGRS